MVVSLRFRKDVFQIRSCELHSMEALTNDPCRSREVTASPDAVLVLLILKRNTLV